MRYIASAGTPPGEESLTLTERLRTASCVAILTVIVATCAIPVARASGSNAEWTVMIYLDGDNNLDPDSVVDIGEMKMVGSTAKVNVLALWDRYDGPANLYQVLPGELKLLDGLTVNGIAVNGQEISMTDWHVLKAFVDYSTANFPANHYMLDLWDHGNAFGYTCWDDHWLLPWTPSPAGAVSLNEVGQAIAGTSMDILTYDGCTIGMSEIAYQLAQLPPSMGVQIQYLVASEEYIPNNGYAYDAVLGHMNSITDVSAGAVAKMLADDYAATYSPHGAAKGSSTVGLSVIDLAKMAPIAPVLKSLTGILKDGLIADFSRYHDMISEARGEANLGWSLNGWDDRVDIGTFLATLSSLSSDPNVKDLANQALGIIKDAVYVANTPALASMSAYGLGVWFPSSVSSLRNANTGGMGVLSEYSLTFAFSQDAGWLSFLHAYWGKTPKK